MLLTERKVRTGGYCTVEFFFRFFGPSRRRGPQTSDKRTRPAVSSCTDRTSSVNKLFIIWHGDIANFFDFVSFKLVLCCPKTLSSSGKKEHLASHSQRFQTLKLPFHKTEFLEKI